MTDSIKRAVKITKDRRQKQILYNKAHGITPKTIIKAIAPKSVQIKGIKHMSKIDISKKIIELEAEMYVAAEKLEFERAIEIRNVLREMKAEMLQIKKTT
jgi:excinuclease ABC subunit B